MKRFWTADLHFGHANIVKYCKRPVLRDSDLDANGKWISNERALEVAKRQDDMLIRNMNQRVKPDDQVVHVGDFINRGYCKGTLGLRNKPLDYLKQLNGNWTLVEGNHDKNNKVKPICQYLITQIAGMDVFVSHYPTDYEHDPMLINWVHKTCQFALVGHVHEKWDHKWVPYVWEPFGERKFLNINVGVDVRRYMPISDDEVFDIYTKLSKAENEKNSSNR